MSKVDWITWKTNPEEIIKPNSLEDKITDEYNNYSSYMYPNIYENIRNEVLNGGLDKQSLNILGESPANEMAINILNNIDEIKSIIENLKTQINEELDEQKGIEKTQLINDLEDKILEEKAVSTSENFSIINKLEERLEQVKTL